MRPAPVRDVPIGTAEVVLERRPDGATLLRSPEPLGPYPAKLTERFAHWARATPERVFIAERDAGGGWRKLTYGEAFARFRSIAQALLDRGLSPERPVAILSDNDVEQALLALAAMHVGVPFVPVSSAYSLVSTDFDRLRYVFELLTPGLVFAADAAKFGRAIEAVVPVGTEVVVAEGEIAGRTATPFAALEAARPTGAVDRAHAAVGPDTIAKFLLTSGSTGNPKAVINTQRMLCANLQMIVQALPALLDPPPVLVDWLPWNHTFGGNHNFGLVIYGGGTLYIDDGKPVPGLIEKTVRNLREIAPTVYFNVPARIRGAGALSPARTGAAREALQPARHAVLRRRRLSRSRCGMRWTSSRCRPAASAFCG